MALILRLVKSTKGYETCANQRGYVLFTQSVAKAISFLAYLFLLVSSLQPVLGSLRFPLPSLHSENPDSARYSDSRLVQVFIWC